MKSVKMGKKQSMVEGNKNGEYKEIITSIKL